MTPTTGLASLATSVDGKPDTAANADAKPDTFRFFISYASEDNNIAIAVCNALQDAMGPAAEVWMDAALRFGGSFQDQIKKKLDETNALIVIHTSITKSAFAFPGLELGYFIRVMGDGSKSSGIMRCIVPIYLDKPPDAIAENEGINIGISRAALNLSADEYQTTLAPNYRDNAVKFLRQFREDVMHDLEARGAERIPLSDTQRDLPRIVQKMQRAIFDHLKTTVDPESVLKPQWQITLKTSDAALCAVGEDKLPDDACLIPIGTGKPMSIFGLQPNSITWKVFLEQTKNSKFHASWADAITKVVTFSLKNQLLVDNSQIILSYNGENTYRIILTTGTRYFNGDREFNLYFVEYLKRKEFGDAETTYLFKGLELFCRFRSVFLEANSEFSAFGAKYAVQKKKVKEFASGIESEMNLLNRDALEAHLDDAITWGKLINVDLILQLSAAWQPIGTKLRAALNEIRQSETGGTNDALTPILEELHTTIGPLNSQVIAQMADKLKSASA